MKVLEFNFVKVGIELPGSFNARHREQIIALLNEAVCFNQGEYIQFEYLVGEKHKALKTELKGANPSKDLLLDHCNKIISYIFNRLEFVSKENFEFIKTYFSIGGRSKILPRVCIKGVRDDRITDIIRDEPFYVNIPYPHISENSGHYHVKAKGRYYCCNDIPLAAKEGSYKNPRLDPGRVRNYKIARLHRFRPNWTDHAWCDCWNSPREPKPLGWESACYKSTLIVPMTLLGNRLDAEFREKFGQRPYASSRTIWGFLCLDHHSPAYFNLDDRRVGYIFADLLSLYYIAAYIHTEISTSFLKAARDSGYRLPIGEGGGGCAIE